MSCHDVLSGVWQRAYPIIRFLLRTSPSLPLVSWLSLAWYLSKACPTFHVSSFIFACVVLWCAVAVAVAVAVQVHRRPVPHQSGAYGYNRSRPHPER